MTFNQDPFSPAAAVKIHGERINSETEELSERAVTDESAPEGTVREILAWVGDDKERAQKALDAENANDDPRKSLVRQLEELIG